MVHRPVVRLGEPRRVRRPWLEQARLRHLVHRPVVRLGEPRRVRRPWLEQARLRHLVHRPGPADIPPAPPSPRRSTQPPTPASPAVSGPADIPPAPPSPRRSTQPPTPASPAVSGPADIPRAHLAQAAPAGRPNRVGQGAGPTGPPPGRIWRRRRRPGGRTGSARVPGQRGHHPGASGAEPAPARPSRSPFGWSVHGSRPRVRAPASPRRPGQVEAPLDGPFTVAGPGCGPRRARAGQATSPVTITDLRRA